MISFEASWSVGTALSWSTACGAGSNYTCCLYVCRYKDSACVAGRIAWHVSWLYGGLCMAVFLVRTMKRIIFHEARQYSAPCALRPHGA
jgi:hypothetical protein